MRICDFYLRLAAFARQGMDGAGIGRLAMSVGMYLDGSSDQSQLARLAFPRQRLTRDAGCCLPGGGMFVIKGNHL